MRLDTNSLQALSNRVDKHKLYYLASDSSRVAREAAKMKVKQEVTEDFIFDLEELLPKTKEIKFFKKVFRFIRVLRRLVELLLRYKTIIRFIK